MLGSTQLGSSATAIHLVTYYYIWRVVTLSSGDIL